MSKPIKIIAFSYTYNLRCKAEIPHMQNAILRYPCVSDTPLTFLPIFLGKACLDARIGYLNPEFYDLVVKFWIQLSVCHIHSHR